VLTRQEKKLCSITIEAHRARRAAKGSGVSKERAGRVSRGDKPKRKHKTTLQKEERSKKALGRLKTKGTPETRLLKPHFGGDLPSKARQNQPDQNPSRRNEQQQRRKGEDSRAKVGSVTSAGEKSAGRQGGERARKRGVNNPSKKNDIHGWGNGEIGNAADQWCREASRGRHQAEWGERRTDSLVEPCRIRATWGSESKAFLGRKVSFPCDM